MVNMSAVNHDRNVVNSYPYDSSLVKVLLSYILPVVQHAYDYQTVRIGTKVDATFTVGESTQSLADMVAG